MNRTETVQVISYLASNNYKELENKTKDQKEIMITTWLDCLKDYDYQIVMKSVKELMQRSLFMPKLAEIIELAKEYKRAINNNIPKLNEGKCTKCKDGLIFYKKIVNGSEYQYVARCECTKGNKYAYDGRTLKDEKNRSDYYVPVISQIFGSRG